MNTALFQNQVAVWLQIQPPVAVNVLKLVIGAGLPFWSAVLGVRTPIVITTRTAYNLSSTSAAGAHVVSAGMPFGR